MNDENKDVRQNEPECEKTVILDRTVKIDTLKEELGKTVQIALSDMTFRGAVSAAAKTVKIKTHSATLGIFDKTRDVGEVIDAVKEKRVLGTIDRNTDETGKLISITESYELEEAFAQGGQGILSLGSDRNLKRPVAVKALREELADDKSQRDSFIAEAKITAQLDHPSIVPIYSLNSDSKDNLYLAMKMINGQNFKTYLEQICTHYKLDGIHSFDERKSLLFRLDMFLKICEALEYAHSRNVMHCDLKPENIMIGEYHEAYLMDWGIARLIEEPDYDPAKWIPPSKITGTPRFLSPEAIKGEHTDQRADIYAMGLILYEVVTLAEAFDGVDVTGVIENIGCGNMRGIVHKFGYKIDSDLKAIIQKATEYEREDRYSSVRELADDIKRYLRSEEVSANPDSWFGRILRWMSVHRIAVLAMILGALLLGAGAISAALYREITRERYQAARDNALSIVFNRCNRTAFIFDKQFAKFENALKSIAAESLFMLNVKLPADEIKVPLYTDKQSYEDSQKSDSNYVRAGLYPVLFDFDRIEYLTVGERKAEDVDRVSRMTLMIPRFRRWILESPYGASLDRDNIETLRKRALQDGMPMLRIYMGFSNGLYVSYPADSQPKDEYDPRNREWYADAVANGNTAMRWGKPYYDYANSLIVLSGTLPLLDTYGKFYGVSALDIGVEFIVRELESIGNSGEFVMEKIFVDKNGEIVLSTGNAGTVKGDMTDANGRRKTLDRNVYSRMRAMKFGHFIVDEEGRSVVYVFAQIPTVSWMYVERLDLANLMALHTNGSSVL